MKRTPKTTYPIKAVAVFNSHPMRGSITFTENLQTGNVIINIKLKGLIPNAVHGLNIHESGDVSNISTSLCDHFNPYKKEHGYLGIKDRHVGDLGNISADKHGNVDCMIEDNLIKLRGSKANVIGRCIVLHENEDDLGLGFDSESTTTGNSGVVIAYSIIGYSRLNFIKV
jgi:superoxide dismutase, Cu-Zn family